METETFTFFYPETDCRISTLKEHEFPTTEKAIEYWRKEHPIWLDITKIDSEKAFIEPNSGEIIVIRSIK